MANHIVRQRFDRLMKDGSPADRIEAYQTIVDTAFKLVYDQQHVPASVMGHDANLLFQMTILKSLSITNILKGVNYQNSITKEMALKNIIDTFSIWALARSQFEAFCTFNHIYSSSTTDERELLYDCWVIAGLNQRQKFVKSIASQENLEKAKSEKQQVQELIEKIHGNSVFKYLHTTEQKVFLKLVGQREFKIKIANGVVKKLGWHELLKNASVKPVFDHLYAMMSLYTHPSNVSVFQFDSMYRENSAEGRAYFALDVSRNIISFFIRDYCLHFPSLLIVFNGLPSINQLLVNSYNGVMRGRDFELNDHHKFV